MPQNRLRATIVRTSAVVLMLLAFAAPLAAQLPPLPPPPVPPPPPPPPAWVLAKVDPLLLDQFYEPGQPYEPGQSYVIVRAQSSDVVGAVSGLIITLGGTLGRNLPILEARAASLPNAAVLTLAASPLVK